MADANHTPPWLSKARYEIVLVANSLWAGSKMSLHSGNMFRVKGGVKLPREAAAEGERGDVVPGCQSLANGRTMKYLLSE